MFRCQWNGKTLSLICSVASVRFGFDNGRSEIWREHVLLCHSPSMILDIRLAREICSPFQTRNTETRQTTTNRRMRTGLRPQENRKRRIKAAKLPCSRARKIFPMEFAACSRSSFLSHSLRLHDLHDLSRSMLNECFTLTMQSLGWRENSWWSIFMLPLRLPGKTFRCLTVLVASPIEPRQLSINDSWILGPAKFFTTVACHDDLWRGSLIYEAEQEENIGMRQALSRPHIWMGVKWAPEWWEQKTWERSGPSRLW